jgi:hypothetical protein
MPEIGQWGPVGTALVDNLETDGGIALKAAVIAEVPALGTPIISFFVGIVCDKIAKVLVQNIDRLVFAGFVAVRVNKQVSDYMAAQASGNQSAIDAAADKEIHIGDTSP